MPAKPPAPAAPAAPVDAKPQSGARPPLIDDPSVTDVFADDFAGLFAVGPNIHLTFATRRPSGRGVQRRVSARLVLPLEATLEMYANLSRVMATLETRGVIKRRSPAKDGSKK